MSPVIPRVFPRGAQSLTAIAITFLVGCSLAGGPGLQSASRPGVPPIAGSVDFGPARAVRVNIGDFAKAATVALIDPETGNTEATTVTDAQGTFVLKFGGTFVPGKGPYFMEAAKGLGPKDSGGNYTANRVGYPLMRVRTLASFDGTWKSLTAGETIILNRSSTAISAIANLKALTNPQVLDLLGKLELNKTSTDGALTSKDTFGATAEITSNDYLQALDLVNQALDQDVDPIGGMFLRAQNDGGPATEKGIGYGLQPKFAWTGDGPVLTRVEPSIAAIDATVTLHGRGLPATAASVSVSLGGVACAVSSSQPDRLTFKVPAGAATGQLGVRIGKWTFGNLFLIVGEINVAEAVN